MRMCASRSKTRAARTAFRGVDVAEKNMAKRARIVLDKITQLEDAIRRSERHVSIIAGMGVVVYGWSCPFRFPRRRSITDGIFWRAID